MGRAPSFSKPGAQDTAPRRGGGGGGALERGGVRGRVELLEEVAPLHVAHARDAGGAQRGLHRGLVAHVRGLERLDGIAEELPRARARGERLEREVLGVLPDELAVARPARTRLEDALLAMPCEELPECVAHCGSSGAAASVAR